MKDGSSSRNCFQPQIPQISRIFFSGYPICVIRAICGQLLNFFNFQTTDSSDFTDFRTCFARAIGFAECCRPDGTYER